MGKPVSASPSVLAFHKLLDCFSYGVTNFTPLRFELLLVSLIADGWHIAAEGEGGAVGGRGLVVSFDDGYRHLAEVLPAVMDRHPGLRPIVFMPTDLIGRPNRWDYSYRLRPTPHLDPGTVRRLAASGVDFGSHGASHTDLTRCQTRQLHAELEDSRKVLQDLTGGEVAAISYPFGRYDERVLAAAARAGYRRGYTMDFPGAQDRPLAQGRYPVHGFDTVWSVRRKLSGGILRRVERFKSRTVSRLSGGTVLLNRLRRRSSE